MPHAMPQHSLDSDRLSHQSNAAPIGGDPSSGRSNGKRGDEEDDFVLGPLPPLWEKTYTASGEVYFIDHKTGTSHWLDPRLARVRKRSLGECAEDELPFGWERVTDERYGSYYVDHIHRRTQYENPVLQATRLRAEKMSMENGSEPVDLGLEESVGAAGSELRGEKFTVTLTKGPQGLGFTLIGGADVETSPELEGYLQIRSIVPHGPAWIDGALRPGDVLVCVCGRGTRGATHAQVAQLFQSIPPGSRVTLAVCRGYPLAFDSEDPHTRVLSTMAVEAPPDNIAMQHLTHALRTRFNLDSPGEVDAGRDETDESPTSPHSPGQRRLMSRSFDLDELGGSETASAAPRCPSADHLLSIANGGSGDSGGGEAGRELELTLRRGTAGFGFTIADSGRGQKVKKVLDRSRCAGLMEGDLLLQIGDTDVRHAPHLRVVQVLKGCPLLQETSLRVWRRASARAPRSRSATRLQTPVAGTSNGQLARSKTPTAEQLRSPPLQSIDPLHSRLNGEATYAVPEHKRESLMDRRRRSSTPGGRLSIPTVAPWNDNQPPTSPWSHTPEDQPVPNLNRPLPNPDRLQHNPGVNQPRQMSPMNVGLPSHEHRGQDRLGSDLQSDVRHETPNYWSETWLDNSSNVRSWAENSRKWEDTSRSWESQQPRYSQAESWGDVGTPTVRVDADTYWRANTSVADSSDNGGFPEDGLMAPPTTAAVGGQAAEGARLRPLSPSASSASRLRSHSPSTNSCGARGRPPPSCFTCNTSAESPGALRVRNYPQMENEATGETEADVLVQLAPGAAGFGFRIVGGTEDGSRVAVGHVVPGGPADGLLRAGDLLTSVDGVSLAGATHARAVAAVFQAAARGRVTLGVRHNRGDVQLELPTNMAAAQHQHGVSETQRGYNIIHPAPLYPPQPHLHPAAPRHLAHNYGGWQYDSGAAAGSSHSGGGGAGEPYDVTVTRGEGEGFGFVVISSANKATSTIGQLIPNSPAAACGMLRVGDTILAINRAPILHLPHPEVVALIKQSGRRVTLTVQSAD